MNSFTLSEAFKSSSLVPLPQRGGTMAQSERKCGMLLLLALAHIQLLLLPGLVAAESKVRAFHTPAGFVHVSMSQMYVLASFCLLPNRLQACRPWLACLLASLRR